MPPWRRLLLACCALALSLPAHAAPCLGAPDKPGFDLHALQSRLMVVALTCRDQGGAEAGYNRMMYQFQPQLKRAYDRVLGHFHRHGGTRRFDDYVTTLANGYAQENIRHGAALCGHYARLWQHLAGFQQPTQLQELASTAPAQTFYRLELCPTPTR